MEVPPDTSDVRRLLTFIAVLGTSGILVPSVSKAAEPPCSERVLTDWSDNGSIDRVYPLPCYDEAIAAMPTDIRDYSNAQGVIERALMSAVRDTTTQPPKAAQPPAPLAGGAIAIDDSGASTVPLPLLVLFGLALAMLAAGALSSFGRRVAFGRKGPPR
jgi:hypothetical protein